MRPNRPLHLLLAAAAVATVVLVPAVHADDELRLATSRYTETTDGALLLDAVPVRLAHAPELVASQCIRVESSALQRGGERARLVNDCQHAVTVSYCIADEQRGPHRCAAVGRRGFASDVIAAGGRLPLTAAVPADADIRWVACRSADHHYSTLTDAGTRGECLIASGPTAIASAAD